MLYITEHVYVGIISKWAEEKRKNVQASGHKEWKSSSTSLINLKNRLGAGNVFSKAFSLWKIKKHQCICSDCLKICLKKRSFTKRLPNNYRHLPLFEKVISCYFGSMPRYVTEHSFLYIRICVQETGEGSITESFLLCL